MGNQMCMLPLLELIEDFADQLPALREVERVSAVPTDSSFSPVADCPATACA